MAQRFRIEHTISAVKELQKWRVFERRRIADEIKKQLEHEPNVKTHNRKIVEDETPSWYFEPPLWEVRIGDCRVFYDIDEANRVVSVRAIRRKPAHWTTGEIL